MPLPLRFRRLVYEDVIPTKVSELDNDKKFQTENEVDEKINALTKSDLGLGNVDNTSDENKPLSKASREALELKEDKKNLKSLAYKDGLTKDEVGLGQVLNVPSYSKTETDKKINEIKNKIGAINGIATLNEQGKVPSSQLPSYVDDVLEFYSIANFPSTGETGKIYVDQTTNKTYRWGGTTYAEISESLALGETDSTAYSGSKGKENAENIQLLKEKTAQIEETLEEVEQKNTEIKENVDNVSKNLEEYKENIGNHESYPVPNSGILEKLYVNFSLSGQEVIDIIESANLTYTIDRLGNNVYYVFYNKKAEDGEAEADMPVSIYITKFTDSYRISYQESRNSGVSTVYTLFNNGKFIFNFDNGYIEVNNEVISNSYFASGSVGAENDKLSLLFSTTEIFNPSTLVEKVEKNKKDIKETKTIAENVKNDFDTYKVSNEEYKNAIGEYPKSAPVPNEGEIGEYIYINTSLSNEEVNSIIENAFNDFDYGESNPVLYVSGEPSSLPRIYCGKFSNGQIYISYVGYDEYEETYVQSMVYTSTSGFFNKEITKFKANPFNNEYEYRNNEKLIDLFNLVPFDERTLVEKTNKIEQRANDTYTISETDKLLKKERNNLEIYKQSVGEYSKAVAVPNEGYVNKIYINIALSKEEVLNIINNNVSNEETGSYSVFYKKETINGNDHKKDLRIRKNNDNFVIDYYFERPDDLSNGGSTLTIFDENGFNTDFNGVLEINDVGTVGIYNISTNDKLISLFSITPSFEEKPTLVESVTDIKSSIGDINAILDILNGEA